MVAKEEAYLEKIRLDRAAIWRNKKPMLAKLDIELTERCNNNCIHCYICRPVNDTRAKKREIPFKKIKKILTEAASLGLITVRFTGGEPLLRADFEDIYLFARQLGLKVRLFTNATLLTPHLAGIFSRIPPLEKIEVTIYGLKRKTYESVSQTPGSFKAAFKGINLLLKYKVPFIVKGAILPPNRGEIAEFDKWAATLPWMDRPPSYSMFFDLCYHHDIGNKNQSIKKMRLSPEEGLKILSRNNNEYKKNLQKFCRQFLEPRGDKLFSCGSGKRCGCVNAYGFFQPCILLRQKESMVNLSNGTLKEALSQFFPKLRELKALNPDYLSRCARCFLQGLCEQCPAKSWLEHGTPDRPVEYLCEIAHIQAQDLGLLAKGEKSWTVTNWEERIKYLSIKKSPPYETNREEAK